MWNKGREVEMTGCAAEDRHNCKMCVSQLLGLAHSLTHLLNNTCVYGSASITFELPFGYSLKIVFHTYTDFLGSQKDQKDYDIHK